MSEQHFVQEKDKGLESAKYYIIFGILLLIMAISPDYIKKLPFTSSIVYLAFGIFLGREGINLIPLDPIRHSRIIEVISEITVITSLFTVGLKLRVPMSHSIWKIPLSFATLSMLITTSLIAGLGYSALGLNLGASILLGAILSPTDPVLASDVQMHHPKDTNRLKFILTSEGGMNDGTAFPLIMLGLGVLQTKKLSVFPMEWLFKDLLWAIFAGLAVGIICGFLITKIARYVKVIRKSFYLEDFLTIASIALSYGIATQIHSYGFLAVFANALTIRQIELRDIKNKASHELPDDVLSFNEQLERIFEVVSVGIVGLLIDIRSFHLKYLVIALMIFLIIRPASIFLVTFSSPLALKDKVFLSWFGVRGIGSVYYLYFVINNLKTPESFELIQYTSWTIFFSVIFHGSSVNYFIKKMGFKKT
jgi:NhaP-type Na+/H+ or K+/H+ antiporter